MVLKPGVSLAGLRPETLAGMVIANEVFSSLSEPLTITSCTDGSHGKNSLHFVGLAFDVRTRTLANLVDNLAERLVAALGDEFDVVVEPTHIHIEYQPPKNRG
jgi:hypothetical protein